MPTSIIDPVTGAPAEVDVGTRALRIHHRGPDLTYNNGANILGSYAISVKSGIEGAGMSAASPILAFLWLPTTLSTSLAVLKRIKFEFYDLGTGFAAGDVLFDFFIARAFTVQDTGGGAITLTTNNAKTRTSHATTQASIRAATTGVLTAGTRTLDANPFRSAQFVVTTTAFGQNFAEEVYLAQPGHHPIVFAPSGEGFVIQATVPATGTWTWSADIDWDEVATY
jgi:hypothetical protein